MHVCLLPTEILLEIFAVYENCGPIPRATLAALARTCRTFKEPALNTLWRHINGFQPLISCLPGCVSSRDARGKLTLKRPLLKREWRIIGQYAQRVRSLQVYPSELDIIDDRVVQALVSAPSPTLLLPNLRRVVWWDERQRFFPLLRILLGSTITSLKLGFSSGAPSFAKSALLASLGDRCPSIRELECGYGGDSKESFRCNMRSSMWIAGAPLSYNRMTVYVNYGDLDGDFPYDPQDVPDLIVSLSECFPPALEKLHFDIKFEFSTLANPSFVLGFDVIAPLLSFSRLTDLRLDWICISAIDDASLKTIAQSWPQLESFWFGSATRWLVPPSLTSIGFVHLIHHCRRLRSIEMPFFACPVDINSEPFSKTIPNGNITAIFAGHSPIVDPITVACQLHILLPKLTEVVFLDCHDMETLVPPPFEQCKDGWTRVNDLLGVLTTSANMREKMGQAPQEPMLPA
ncbi:hypothetical protein DFH29DRAFT_1069845 [Suillus ampliporus]|nr:hypothetical protein DFH29DRAFT_1069845 [Suillus ampliporus]